MSLLDKFVLLFETDASDASRSISGLNRELGDTENRANDAADGMDDVSKSANDMTINIADAIKITIQLAASFASLNAIKDQIIQTALMTDTLGKLTQTMGFNIQQMDAWGAAAERNGGSAAAFQSSVIGIQDSLSSIQFGGGQGLLKTLSMMGINAFNSNGQLKDSFDILTDISSVFENMSVRKSAAFGKMIGLDQGTILLLQQSRHNLMQLTEQQEQYGSVTNDAYLAAADFNDAQDNLSRSLKSVWQIINTAILPVFTSFLNSITDIISWMRENEDLTVGFFSAIAVAITTIALPSILSLGAAIAGLAAPFAIPAAAIAGLAAIFALLFEDVKAYIAGNSSYIGDLAKKYEWFGKIIDGLIVVFEMLWEGLKGLFDWGGLFINDPISAIDVATSKIKQEFSDLWDWIKNLFDFSFLSDAVTNAFSSVGDFFGFVPDDGIGQFGSNAKNILMVSDIYGGNPLNANTSNIYGGTSIYNQNSFAFSNNINAKGVTPEQVKNQFNDEFGSQIATAGNMIDDGISY